MKIKSAFIIIVFMLFGCAQSAQVPVWKDNAYRYLEDYKNHFLSGREDPSEPHFLKALKEISAGNDLNLLSIAYLTKYALHTASLEYFDTSEFAKIDRQEPNTANMTYCHFLKGNFTAIDTSLLPSRYLGMVKAASAKDTPVAAKEISAIDDPLSRLVACGVWIKYMPNDETILQIAIDTASARGWRRPLWAYLERLRAYYAERNDTAKAARIKQRLELLRK